MGKKVTAHPSASATQGRLQFSLRTIFLVMLVLGTSLAVGRFLHPLWGALFLTYAVLGYCVSSSVIRPRLRLPLVLASLHTLLATVAGAIEYASAWDDMNATMLILMAVYMVDLPIHQTWEYFGLFPDRRTTWYPTQLVITGALLWFAIGLLLHLVMSWMRHAYRWLRKPR